MPDGYPPFLIMPILFKDFSRVIAFEVPGLRDFQLHLGTSSTQNTSKKVKVLPNHYEEVQSMKKFIGVMIIFLMLFSLIGCSSDAFIHFSDKSLPFDKEKIDSEVVQGNSEFAFDIFKQLNDEDKEQNVFISPLSISTALSMTYQGAETTTKEAMAEALNYDGIERGALNESYKNLLRYLQQVDSKVELNISNSIWIKEGQAIKQEFIDTNEQIFNAHVTQLDFSKDDAADKINQWIDSSTKGKIDKMLEPPISPQVIMYLINAIYFKGEWTEQFDKKETFNTVFRTGSGQTTDVKMMSRKGEVGYGQGSNYKAVRLDYGSGKTSMYLVLPEEGIPVNDFITGMTPNKWQVIKDSVSKTSEVLVQIPRFKMEYGIKKLKDSLSALGMAEAFSDTADFSGMREGIFISRVLHKAVIEVNEEGSEAAGVTVVEMQESAAVEPLRFTADRPFMFVIEDNEFGTILFMGKAWDVSE